MIFYTDDTENISTSSGKIVRKKPFPLTHFLQVVNTFYETRVEIYTHHTLGT